MYHCYCLTSWRVYYPEIDHDGYRRNQYYDDYDGSFFVSTTWPSVCFKWLTAMEIPGFSGSASSYACPGYGGKPWIISDVNWRVGRQPSISITPSSCVDVTSEAPAFLGVANSTLRIADCEACILNASYTARAFEGFMFWIGSEGTHFLGRDYFSEGPVAVADPMYPSPVVGCRATDGPGIKWVRPLGSLNAAKNEKNSFNKGKGRYDFQGVVKLDVPNSDRLKPYPLEVEATIINNRGRYRHEWELAPAAGTLTPNPNNPQKPTHVPPAIEGQGILTLTLMDGNSPSCSESKEVKIYKDHLQRDYENFYQFNTDQTKTCRADWKITAFNMNPADPQKMDVWNCLGSVRHAFNGDTNGYFWPVDDSSLGLDPNDFTQEPHNNPTETEAEAIGNTLLRGDVMSYYYEDDYGNPKIIHAHTSLGGDQMFGANNEAKYGGKPLPGGGIEGGTWKWAVCKPEEYFRVWSSSNIKKLIVWRKKVN